MSSVTKKDLVITVSEETDLTQVDSKIIVEEVLDTIAEILENNAHLEIRGFGTFYPQKRKPRPARNIKTGEVVPLPERIVPLFRYSSDLRNKIDNALKGGEIKDLFVSE